MLMKFSLFVLLVIVVVCQTSPLYDHRYNDDDDDDNDIQLKSLTGEQLAELDEYLSRKILDESASEYVDRNTRRPDVSLMSKRDALWTTTEVLDCVRRLKLYKDRSKLDLVTEMLNCYRRLKHSG